jgi:sortase A
MAAHRTSARALVRLLGAVVAVGGLAVLAWAFVVWQWGDPLTGAYTRWQQHELSAEYRRTAVAYTARRAQGRTARPPRESVRVAARRYRAQARTGAPIGRIRAARLGLDMVVVNGTDTASLRKGPGRDPRTSMPGEGQLVYIAGHRTTYGAPFAHLDRLHRGDSVVLELPYARFEYRVVRSVIVPAHDLARLRSHGREELALQACHPRFSARERLIVYARPVSVRAAGGGGRVSAPV